LPQPAVDEPTVVANLIAGMLNSFYDVEVLVAGDLAPVLRKSYSDPGTLQQPDYLIALFAHWAIMLAVAILLLSSIIM
jgi:hypothetical protein